MKPEQVTIEADRVLNFLASMPLHANTVVTRPVVRQILANTDAQLMANGTLWDVTTKHLGAGMYRVSLKAKP